MRNDMHKRIVNCGRYRDSWAGKGRPVRDLEDMPHQCSMRTHDRRAYASKYSGDRLAPLRRYVRAQVGRKWDDVYADIRAQIDTRHTVKMHILEHLYQFVETKVRVQEDGRLLFVRNWGGESEWSGCETYVDPRDGRLHPVPRENNRRYRFRRRKKAAPKDRIVISNHKEFRKIDGLWYAVRFARTTAPKLGLDLFYDVLKRQEVQAGGRIAVDKKQLSKHELAAHGLKNDVI